MVRDRLKADEELAKIEKWFAETYKSQQKPSQEVDLLILHKLHQLEERLKVIEHQTKTHWAN